ncbi:MAG: beta-phosphoglucomutase family hydrolase [candidate division Zixibacteria bacterium]|nr:beta-phosphoglucomutase family hydrolase [candidate division Zixibacteria bacterium]
MPHIKGQTLAVIFDMDGVIVDNMKYHKKAWELFLMKYAPDMDGEEFSENFGKVNKDLLKIVFQREVTDEEESRFGDEKEALYRELYAEDIAPTDGLVEFLHELKENSVKTAVASAAPKVNVDFVFEKTGLRQYFDVSIDANDVTRGKPDPEIYLKTAEKLNCPPEACLVFEDSMPGIQAGRNAGMKVIGVATSHPADKLKDTEFVIKDFTEINFKTVLDYLITAD